MADFNSSLPIRTESNGDVVVKIVDNTITSQGLSVDSGGRVTTKISDGTDQLEINADGSVSVNIRDGAGSNFSNTNPLPVSIQPSSGTEVNDYNTSASLAASASSNHDYTAVGTFTLNQIEASASAKLKIEVQVETGVASGVFNTYFVKFNSTSDPNMSIVLKNAITVAAGVRVRVIRTNRDNQSQDVYSTICGIEN